MTESDFTALFVTVVFGTMAVCCLVGFAISQLSRIARMQELILRKLNNQQPDNEGGY